MNTLRMPAWARVGRASSPPARRLKRPRQRLALVHCQSGNSETNFPGGSPSFSVKGHQLVLWVALDLEARSGKIELRGLVSVHTDFQVASPRPQRGLAFSPGC